MLSQSIPSNGSLTFDTSDPTKFKIHYSETANGDNGSYFIGGQYNDGAATVYNGDVLSKGTASLKPMMLQITGLLHPRGIKHLKATAEQIIHARLSQIAEAVPHKTYSPARLTASHRITEHIQLRRGRKAEAIHLRHVQTAGHTQHPAGAIHPLPGHPEVFHHPAVVQADHLEEEAVAQVVVEAGVAEGKFISEEEIETIAKIPSRQELLSMIVGNLNAPITGLVWTLKGMLAQLIYTLNSLINKTKPVNITGNEFIQSMRNIAGTYNNFVDFTSAIETSEVPSISSAMGRK